MDSRPVPPKLQLVAADLAQGVERSESVRTVLSWFRAERRGRWVVDEIRRALRNLGLETVPDFRYAYIDEPIAFKAKLTPQNEVSGARDPAETVVPYMDDVEVMPEPEMSASTVDGAEESPLIASVVADPTYRIGRLISANSLPLAVNSDDTVTCAITHMLANQYSQLPVLDGERNLRGKISWRSIGSRLVTGAPALLVRECLEPCELISADSSLFSAIDAILRDDCVLVRDRTNRITGIVTAHDLSVQFNQLGEPFLLIQEIENHVRRVLANKFTAQELRAARDPSDGQREIRDISDLSFGECVRIMQDPLYWERLALPIDRQVVTGNLESVRLIRNDVMHFDPDGIGGAELARLRMTVAFFQQLVNIHIL